MFALYVGIRMIIDPRFGIPQIHHVLVTLREVITEDRTDLSDNSLDSEDELSENSSHLLMSFEASLKEFVLLNERCREEPTLMRMIEEILSELLYQDIEYSSFSNNLFLD